MKVAACLCTGCSAQIWRTVRNPATGEALGVWPRPNSAYVRLGLGTDHLAVGIGFCQRCVPTPGAIIEIDGLLEGTGLPVITVEWAGERYQAWYEDAWGRAFRAWALDYLQYPQPEVDALMRQWDADRREAVLGISVGVGSQASEGEDG